MSFEKIKKAVQSGKLHHAFLFLGADAQAQKETALKLAAWLFCESPKEGEACGECSQCRLALKNEHPDFITIGQDPDEATIKIEEVRTMIAQANLKPYQAKAKLFLLEGAERLNEVSQNALLKTLEEPPGSTYFVLSAKDSSQLLETIRSRTQTVYFSSTGRREGGEKALALGRQIARYIVEGSESGVAPEPGALERFEIGQALDHAVEYFRHTLLMRIGAEEILDSIEEEGVKKRIASERDEEEWVEIIELLGNARERIVNQMANAKIIFSCLWDDLRKTHAR